MIVDEGDIWNMDVPILYFLRHGVIVGVGGCG